MASFSDQLQEIKTLISSNAKSYKSFAYSTLLQLQEQCSSDTCSIQSLVQESQSVLSQIIVDIADDDEEIASQALKCLGFMIYHPSLVVAIPVEDANFIVQSLAELIVTTKMKTVCNLGVWCISIQQFSASFLATHFHCLLRAIVHALDNPIGSLSTTYEAIQAVMKLVTELREKMINTSNIWAPSIYRRLVSVDKRERDMSERCLLKIKSAILPPSLTLSKALVIDMTQKLLPGMKEMLNLGMKVQTMQAWGWFIRLLGSHAMKKRHLVNEMLKIPELTFSDHDPQVQISSQVAWEGLIDALIHPPLQACETNKTAQENGVQKSGTSTRNNSEIQTYGFSKSVKLIMTPLIGIMLSKCDISVRSSCLNTWCYLLHKLDISVNDPLVVETVLAPILEAVFQTGPDSRSIWLWNLCVDLFDDFVLAKSRGVDCDLNHQVSDLSARTSILGLPIPGKCSWKHYPIKWLSWDLSKLDFHIKMICTLINQGSKLAVLPENRILACEAAIRIFRSVLKGVQIEMKNPSVDYNQILLCLNTILRFTKKISEDVGLADTGIVELHYTFLQFVEAVTTELEPSILGSPLYKVAFDIKYIDRPLSVYDINHAEVLGIRSIAYMDMASPVVYLTMLYVYIAVHATFDAPKMEFILLGVQKHFKFLMSLYDPLENLCATIVLLYKHMRVSCLNIWVAIAQGLEDYIKDVKDLSPLKTELDSYGCLAVCHLLSYPFVLRSCLPKQSSLTKISGSSQRKLELEHVTEVWKSLYGFVNSASRFECSNTNIFSEDLCSMLSRCLDENSSKLDYDTELDPSDKKQYLDLLSLCGDIVIYILEHTLTLRVNSEGTKNKDDDCSMSSSGINSSLGLIARFMRMPCTIMGTDAPICLAMTSRVFNALVRFVGHLHLKQNILSYIEIMSSSLLQWLSHVEKWDESTIHKLGLLWTETLNCLRRSQPPIIFDSSFLELQAPLLEKTLDHPNPSISDSTIAFWNSTYSEQIQLDYPQSLCHVLDKLSRSGRINLCKRTPSFLQKCNSRVEVATPQRYKVTATKNRSSKRVELVEATVNDSGDKDKPSPSLKRKRLELTEHQKEVRRAQQGRERDTNGHGPGIRTYTSVDFSQGNEESQESQEIRNPESIFEKLRRAS
ncbi:hypothetical protein VitviT2T_016711 [Vitis vinifera]|uniref:Telomere-associated protein Rif1 N-terminal domain-containing protein n=4 Tax=Vitis vinifera TaxID=29760 RepID=A0ABY9CSJ0_VITVI|nr:uncharacterized protein LOC104880667 isoform X1 [Vitis vinifera]WJZ98163.1 hypothetical protein VitviT2T_016711 [Vitis vinifera]|eukprot:XP_010656472.1 PREDICTED: uncharacterized protein LOC104880667 isoform X1 [Vitis vinifera]